MSATLLEIPSPFAEAAGTLRLPEPAHASRDALCERLRNGTYERPFVLDDGNSRSLFFDLRFVQSTMRLDAPDALEVRYTQKMMAFLLFGGPPKALLLLGLGGGSLAKFCYRRLPQARITVVEIDPDVIALRDEFFMPPDDERLQVVGMDARAYLDAAGTPRVDVLLIDVCGRDGIPPALAGRDFLQAAADRLTANGVLCMNLPGGRERHAALIADAEAVFDGRIIVIGVRDDGNSILYAFRNRLFEPRWRQLAARAHELEARFGLEFPAFVRKMERAARLSLQRQLGILGA